MSVNAGRLLCHRRAGQHLKPFPYDTLLARVRGNGNIALAVASSGIAALLLEGRRTTHSQFKIPVNGLNTLSTRG